MRLLEDAVKGVQKAHKAIFDENLKPIGDRLKSIDEQIVALQQQYADLTQLAGQLKQSDNVQASLLILERSPIANFINQQNIERLRLLQLAAPPQTRPTELLGEIIAPTEPSKPKKILMLGLAAVFGLMGAVMLAFVTEFVSKVKVRVAEQGHTVDS